MISTSPPSGFRDFVNEEARLRFDLMVQISRVYQSFGFLPLETPALENLQVLLGSGGGQENEKLIFKIMKRGEKLKEALAGGEDAIADFGMRFDLTVPLSRCAAQYAGQIKLPWKVFHMGPVWRAERAQKGRFREFIQCDVDIVGAKSWVAELEVIQAVVSAVHQVGAEGFELKINDRRILQGIGEKLGLGSQFDEFAILLDKKDKMEPSELRDEMKQFLGSKFSNVVEDILSEKLTLAAALEFAPQAGGEMKSLIEALNTLKLPLTGVVFDPSLVRGLGYYTGPVFELRHSSAGYSFGGGGRYDQLIGRFSKQSLPACGFSIGFERLFMLLKDREAEKAQLNESSLFIPVFSEDDRLSVIQLGQSLRQKGFSIDIYPDASKLKAQFKYASDRGYRWLLIAGSDELKSRKFKIKDMGSSEEVEVGEQSLAEHLKKIIS